VTLTRTGNGSELPHTIYFAHSTRHNSTWARAQVDSETEYERLERPGSASWLPPWAGGHAASMLMATPQVMLEPLKPRYISGPWDHQRVPMHKFDKDDADATEIAFQVVLPM
jgi:uncharacterized protein (DUF2236 family)